jgi:triacylglycerol esterase/lipase EstA (alpha/beta hydrolase family)
LELLSKDLGTNHSLILVQYTSNQLWLPHFTFNIPDYSLHDLGESVANQLEAAQVGQRPFVIIAFSMGGVVTREVILNQLSDAQLKNLRSVVFIASPLGGSNMKEQVKKELERIVPALNHF